MTATTPTTETTATTNCAKTYDDGFCDGYRVGAEDGYAKGYDCGTNEGYRAAVTERVIE